jgi:Putative prokaryotic signal transducing protein
VSEQPLVCPSCGRPGEAHERFCAACGMPLVYADDEAAGQAPTGVRHEMARKIKPQYTEGALVKVARARNQIEAEFIEGLLLEEGIPCVLSGLISGYAPVIDPRDVLVPQSGAQAAREALAWERP